MRHADATPLAVVRMGAEYFALPLNRLQEFHVADEIMPIPGCPPHIAGAVNLRGDFVPVIDIRSTLGIRVEELSDRQSIVVLQQERHRVGIVIDAVLGVQNVRQHELKRPPVSLQTDARGFLKGMAPYGNAMMGILDIDAVLAEESLIVERTP